MTEELAEFATLDLDREDRQGLPEVIYAPGKTPLEITAIANELLVRTRGAVFATRVSPEAAASVLELDAGCSYDSAARLLSWRSAAQRSGLLVTVVTAGTADGPVAAEAAAVAELIGMDVNRISDVGVAGPHRLLARAEELRRADVVIVIAGMEAAIASVIGGLVAVPVVAVPTSTGYGAALEGITALLGMLSSCAAGIAVVNIDSGFSAAMVAHRLTCRPAR